MLIERKDAFNQSAGNLGRRWIQSPPKTTSENSAQPWTLLKGNREVISVIIEIECQSCHRPLPRAVMCAGLSTPHDLSLGAILFTQFVHEMTEGEAREEI